MEEIKKIIKSFFWYIKRPQLIPNIYHTARKRYFYSDKELTKKESMKVCKQEAITTKEFFIKLNIVPSDINKEHKKTLTISKQSEKECPVKMGGAGDLNLLYNLCEHYNVKEVIETGVAYGWSSLAILLSLNKRKKTKLISIDMPYLFRNNDQYVGCVVPKEIKNNWKLINLADRQGIPKAVKEIKQLDLCHYDSDKSYYGRMWAYAKLWKKLKKGGIFISDDIGDNLAFLDFSKKIGCKPYIIKSNNKYIGVLMK